MAQSEEYATREDLHRVEDRLERGVTDLRAQITTARQEHHEEHRAMREESRAEHQAMREEYRQGVAAVAAGIEKLRRDGIWFGLALAGLLAAIDVLA